MTPSKAPRPATESQNATRQGDAAGSPPSSSPAPGTAQGAPARRRQQDRKPAAAPRAARPNADAARLSPDPAAHTAEDLSGTPVPSVATDAPYATGAQPSTSGALRNMSEIRHFLRTNTTPIFFVGATPFNLLGLDRWVRGFSYVTYYDPWDGSHPRVFTPALKPYAEFESGEQINNWLLQNPEVRAHMARFARNGVRPKVVMVFFDHETEQICEELGYDLILPSAALREHLDSKLVTTRLGNDVGVPSVPNTMATVGSWDELRQTATSAGLGEDLVVQTAYGDSGKTTFFMSCAADWDAAADEIVGHELKIMKRIDNHPVAVEAVLTRRGTIVGPFMTELTGHPELTPYRGGWCGNEMFPDVLSPAVRAEATAMVRRLGDRLGAEGYRGFFEVDVLVDQHDHEVYLGELNPRISGASAITHVTAGAYADVPLFAFHLLEFLDVDFMLDVEEINERWEVLAGDDMWSQMVIKETGGKVERIDAAAPTGQYDVDPAGALVFRRAALDWHQLQDESEVFYMRIYGPGDYLWKGADMGIVVTKGRLQTQRADVDQLTIRARHLVDSLRAQYRGTLVQPPSTIPSLARTPSDAPAALHGLIDQDRPLR